MRLPSQWSHPLQSETRISACAGLPCSPRDHCAHAWSVFAAQTTPSAGNGTAGAPAGCPTSLCGVGGGERQPRAHRVGLHQGTTDPAAVCCLLGVAAIWGSYAPIVRRVFSYAAAPSPAELTAEQSLIQAMAFGALLFFTKTGAVEHSRGVQVKDMQGWPARH